MPADLVDARAYYGGPQFCYRYRLEWLWDPDLPTLMALMMNPSTASHKQGDATVAKLHRYGRSWGYGRLLVGNADAYRARDQARLAEVEDPCGPENEAHVLSMAAESDLILVGYGRPKVAGVRGHGARMARALEAAGHRLYALKVSADNVPHHPLYLRGDLLPAPWSPIAP